MTIDYYELVIMYGNHESGHNKGGKFLIAGTFMKEVDASEWLQFMKGKGIFAYLQPHQAKAA